MKFKSPRSRPSHGRDSSAKSAIVLPSSSSMRTNKDEKTKKKRVVVEDTFRPSLEDDHHRTSDSNGIDPISRARADLESCWIAGFLHHEEIEREREIAKLKSKILLLPGGGLPPPTTLTSATGRRFGTDIYTQKSDTSNSKSYAFTEEDERRLLEVQKRLTLAKSKANGSSAPIQKLSPYLPVKKYALKSKKLIRRERGNRMRSKHLEAYFEITRSEMEASIVIQCFWRSILASRRLHDAIQYKMAIIVIQKTIRMYIAKCWVKAWKKKRDYYVLRCQARIRQITASRWWKKTLAMECTCAIIIQKTIRLFLAKCQLLDLRRNMAAHVIQSTFRAWVSRRKHRRRVEGIAATDIQRMARGVISRTFVHVLSVDMNMASLDIQKFWRGHLARRRRTMILRDRFATHCIHTIFLINAEINHYEYELEKLDKDWYTTLQTEEENLHTLRQSLEETISNLVTSEENTRELFSAKAQMTPMSVSDGWEEEVDNSLKHERSTMTKMKLDAILNLKRKMARQTQQRKEYERKKMELERTIEELKTRRTFLRNNHKVGDSERKLNRERRARAADEKRKWKVQHRTPSGKPLKGGNAVAISWQFCSGNVDLYAASNEPSTERLIKMIELQNYVKQVHQFDRLLRPLNSMVMKK